MLSTFGGEQPGNYGRGPKPFRHEPTKRWAIVTDAKEYRRSIFGGMKAERKADAGLLAANSWRSIRVTDMVLSDNGNVQTVLATFAAGTARRFVHLKVTHP